MDSITVMSLMIRIILHRTRLSLKTRGTMLLVVDAMVEGILLVIGTIRAKTVTNGTNLE